MYKNILFLLPLLSLATLSHAMEDQSLYLVVGSTRKNNVEGLFPVENIWQERQADLTHIHTYGGKATTMDIEESVLPNAKHIVADASSYTFQKNTIHAAYLERLPTKEEEENSLGECIKNIGKAMIHDAIMEIEWHPYTTIVTKKLKNTNSIYDEQRVKQNPFTAAIDFNIASVSIAMVCVKKFAPNINWPKQFVTCAQTLSKPIKQLLDFYEKENIGEKSLLENRLDEELSILQTLIETDQKVLLSQGPSASLEDFSQAIDTIEFIETDDPSLVGTHFPIYCEGKIIRGTLYDVSHFLSNSFLNFLLCDASIEYNSPYVKEFMQDNGFKNVTIERTESPRNGRKNVWIVKGIKS